MQNPKINEGIGRACHLVQHFLFSPTFLVCPITLAFPFFVCRNTSKRGEWSLLANYHSCTLLFLSGFLCTLTLDMPFSLSGAAFVYGRACIPLHRLLPGL